MGATFAVQLREPLSLTTMQGPGPEGWGGPQISFLKTPIGELTTGKVGLESDVKKSEWL